MGFNRRKMEDQRREAAEKEAANRRATDAQVLEDAERPIAAWNERQFIKKSFCTKCARRCFDGLSPNASPCISVVVYADVL